MKNLANNQSERQPNTGADESSQSCWPELERGNFESYYQKCQIDNFAEEIAPLASQWLYKLKRQETITDFSLPHDIATHLAGLAANFEHQHPAESAYGLAGNISVQSRNGNRLGQRNGHATHNALDTAIAEDNHALVNKLLPFVSNSALEYTFIDSDDYVLENDSKGKSSGLGIADSMVQRFAFACLEDRQKIDPWWLFRPRLCYMGKPLHRVADLVDEDNCHYPLDGFTAGLESTYCQQHPDEVDRFRQQVAQWLRKTGGPAEAIDKLCDALTNWQDRTTLGVAVTIHTALKDLLKEVNLAPIVLPSMEKHRALLLANKIGSEEQSLVTGERAKFKL